MRRSHRTLKSRVPRRGRVGRVEVLEDRRLLAVITVNTTADDTTADATLSLREAIEVSDGTLAVSALSTQEKAQVSGAVAATNTIGFDIPKTDPGFNAATGAWTIALTSQLPTIGTNAAIINGYTQPGSSENTLAQADNAKLTIAISGKVLGQPDGLTIAQPGSRVSGLDIENFGSDGVLITAAGNVQVAGCFIGTDPTGEAAAPDANGVAIENSFNTIGGPLVGDRNVISGNTTAGEGNGLVITPPNPNLLNILPTGNVIENNFIGIDAAGTKSLANGQAGVDDSGTGNTYGGTTPGLGNVISGNAADGIKASGSITAEGNFIGTDAAGNVALGNGLGGWGITNPAYPSTQAITTTITNNLVSGNKQGGIGIAVGIQKTSVYTILNNRIGTNAAGTAALGNTGTGLDIESAENATVRGNLISANTLGISVDGFGPDVAHDVFQGNIIGSDVTGHVNLGNTDAGIVVLNGIGDTFGGSGAGQGNVIAFNGSYGIDLESNGGGTLSKQDLITQNSIFGNKGRGIYLSTGGTNNFQEPPTLTFTPGPGGSGTLSGTLGTASAGKSYVIEIFSNPTVPVAGVEQGKTFIQALTVVADGGGKGTFSIDLPTSVYTATATDSIGDTSAFSKVAGTPGLPATTTALTSSLNPSTKGQSVTFTAVVAAPGTPGTPTGTVTFDIDGNAEPPVPLAVVGGVDEAVFTTSALGAGQHPVTAAYGGDASLSPSSGSLPTQTVVAASSHPTATVVTVASSLNPSTFGQSVTFTAVVAAQGSQGTPTGAVTFTIDGNNEPPVPLAVVGGVDEAVFITSGLAEGRHSVTAAYGGSPAFATSAGNTVTQSVNAPPPPVVATSTDLTMTPNPSVFGQQVVLTAKVTAADGSAAGGTVTFMDGTSLLGVGLVGPGGQATDEVTSLQLGTDPIMAIYGGDSLHARSVSNSLAQVIEPPSTAPPTVSSLERYGYHDQPTTLVLAFSAALDAASAQDVRNYQIHLIGKHGRVSARRSIAVKEAIYEPLTSSITLVPAQRLNIHYRYQLAINGTTQTGVRGASGLLLDGNGEGKPGSNYLAEIDLRTVAGPAPGFGKAKEAGADRVKHADVPSATAFDSLAAMEDSKLSGGDSAGFISEARMPVILPRRG